MKKFFVSLTIIFVVLTACMDTDSEQNEESNEQLKQTNDSQQAPEEDVSNQKTAEHLAQLANRVSGVDEATAIIAGPYAIIAIDVDETLDRERVGTVKYSVSEALYKDPYGKTAVVIADADLIERFKQMGNKIQEGLPLEGVVEELAAIVGRYMPVMPTRDQPNQTDTNENEEDVNDDENSKLEDIQEDQSNSDKYE